jgi:UDP-N-acetylglucosamine--N-acetylmuramyl-(pentapeptide) pyrophosphoryl-undecaprenol N-acetylglucosamine transferase
VSVAPDIHDDRTPMTKRTILIAGGGTGGHLTPALAIASAIESLTHGLEPVLVGAIRGVEAKILPTREFRYHLLPSEPIYRRTWWKNFRWPLVAGRLLRGVDELLQAERPAAVLGTGGYASAPVVWRAAHGGLPTAIQEQNAYPGLATRWLSRRVRHVYLGLPETRRLLRFGSRTQVFDTGNPIVPPTPERRLESLKLFGLAPHIPVVLVTGGSQGALAINRAVADWLEAGGPDKAALIWVTGRATYQEFARFHRPPAVHVLDYLDPMADGYAVADLVISRAGMITVAELCAWGLPSILIPLPTAADDHQSHNARVLAQAGATLLLPQSDLTPGRLGETVNRLLSEDGTRQTMANRAQARGKPEAAAEIVSNLLTLVR